MQMRPPEIVSRIPSQNVSTLRICVGVKYWKIKIESKYPTKIDYAYFQNTILRQKDSFIKYLDFVMISQAVLPLLNRENLSVMGKKRQVIHSFNRNANLRRKEYEEVQEGKANNT